MSEPPAGALVFVPEPSEGAIGFEPEPSAKEPAAGAACGLPLAFVPEPPPGLPPLLPESEVSQPVTVITSNAPAVSPSMLLMYFIRVVQLCRTVIARHQRERLWSFVNENDQREGVFHKTQSRSRKGEYSESLLCLSGESNRTTLLSPARQHAHQNPNLL